MVGQRLAPRPDLVAAIDVHERDRLEQLARPLPQRGLKGGCVNLLIDDKGDIAACHRVGGQLACLDPGFARQGEDVDVQLPDTRAWWQADGSHCLLYTS